MPRLPLLAVSLLSCLALSGCLASGDQPTATAEPPTSATASPSPNTASATPDVLADTYCEHAEDGYDALITLFDHTDAKSAQTGRDGEGNVATMNAEGAAMLAAIEDVEEHWTAAQGIVVDEGDAVSDAFDDFFTMVTVFTRPEATLAAESASIDEYSVATAALLAEPGVVEAATEGALGLEAILQYNESRC